MFFDVTVKSNAAASHLHDDLRLFRFFRIGMPLGSLHVPIGRSPWPGLVYPDDDPVWKMGNACQLHRLRSGIGRDFDCQAKKDWQTQSDLRAQNRH